MRKEGTLALLALLGLFLCAAGAEQPKAEGLSADLRARLAIAQRNYQMVKAPLDLELAKKPETQALYLAMKEVDEACKAVGKVANFDAVKCDDPPKAPAPQGSAEPVKAAPKK